MQMRHSGSRLSASAEGTIHKSSRLTVVCRVYSSSCCSIEPRLARRIGWRSSTCRLSIASTAIVLLGKRAAFLQHERTFSALA